MPHTINGGPLADALAADALGASANLSTRALYLRYLKTLALLCECAPYVDEPDFLDQIEEVLNDASAYYPLRWQRDEQLWEIAPREPTE